MTISPMFSQRFQELLYQKLDDLREQQQQQQPSNDDNDALLQQQQPTPSSYNTLSEQEGL